ncbi:MAG: hypothetical protein ABI978_07070, partial [Chloroflexota bacterium]
MNDEQLTRLFRSLDELAEPRAAFADSLFADLERMTSGAIIRRRTSAGWLLVAATLLLVASLGAALAIGSGLLKLPFVVDVVLPTPSASATTLESTPAPSQSASTTPTASPSPAAGAIVIDGLAKSTVDGLRVRATPGTAGAQLGTIDTGVMGFVLAGPVSADGYVWYQLAALGLPPNAGCEPPFLTTPFNCPDWLGWVAAGQPGSQTWLAPTTLPCPASPMNLEALFNVPALGTLTPVERLACYGSTSIRVRGWWPQIPDGAGLGGLCEGVVPPNPAWLVCQNINYNGLAISESAGFDGAGMKISIDPATGVTMPPRGQWVEVVGHLDDPAARDCAPVASGDQDPVRVVLTCRSELVAESV